MTLSDYETQARELVKRWETEWDGRTEFTSETIQQFLVARITAALQAERERCAKVALEHECDRDDCAGSCLRAIAAAITA